MILDPLEDAGCLNCEVENDERAKRIRGLLSKLPAEGLLFPVLIPTWLFPGGTFSDDPKEYSASPSSGASSLDIGSNELFFAELSVVHSNCTRKEYQRQTAPQCGAKSEMHEIRYEKKYGNAKQNAIG
jgi:hypothetical protein